MLDFDLSHCELTTADFSYATFSGITRFRSITFSGIADFEWTTFSAAVDLSGTQVSDVTRGHVWPPGWTVEPMKGTTGKLVSTFPVRQIDKPS